MAQHDYVIDNSTGANVRADINSALQAIVTNNSGSSAPSSTFPFMLFADSSAGTMKIRNAADNAFIELFQLDGTFTLEDGSESTPALAFRDDLNTGIFSSAADTFNVATGGVERMELGTTTIFNEDGADVDFRIEGDTDTNLFYADAGNNRIGLGIASPTSKLYVNTVSTEHVITAATADTNGNSIINILSAGTTGNSRILFSDTAANDGIISYSHNDRALVFGTAGTSEDMRLDSSGRLLIGHSSHLSVAGVEAHLQVLGTGSDDSSIMLSRTSNDIHPAFLCFVKSRANLIGDVNSVASGDSLGKILFFGADGTDDDTVGAEIDVFVDGTPGANDMPSRIVFKTTKDGANSPSSAMTVNSSQNVGIGTETPAKKLHVLESGAATIRLETGDSRGQAFDFLSTNGSTNNSGTLSIRNEAGQELLNLADGGGTTNQRIDMFVNGSRKFRFDNDGLKFGSDTAAINALNDYEEGSVTITMHSHSDKTNVTGSGNTTLAVTGHYIKIGQFVHVAANFNGLNASGGNDRSDHVIFKFTGLPFASYNGTGACVQTTALGYNRGVYGRYNQTRIDDDLSNFYYYIGQNSTEALVNTNQTDTAGSLFWALNSQDSGMYIGFQVSYRTA